MIHLKFKNMFKNNKSRPTPSRNENPLNKSSTNYNSYTWSKGALSYKKPDYRYVQSKISNRRNEFRADRRQMMNRTYDEEEY